MRPTNPLNQKHGFLSRFGICTRLASTRSLAAYGVLGCAAWLAACSEPIKPAPLHVSYAWQDAPLLAADNEWGAFDHHEAVDAQGHTLAVWEQFDGERFNIWANRKAKGQGWGVAQLIETDNAGSAYNPRVAIDSQGNAVAVWQQFDGQQSRIAANRYMVGTGWSKAQWIDAPNTVEAHAPQVRFDNQGNAIAVWQQKLGQHTRIAVNRMAASSGWGDAALVENGNGYASAPHIANDAQGQLFVLWQVQGAKDTIVHAKRYHAGGGWASEQLVKTAATDTSYPPTVFGVAF
jgi:hypothetical protein